MLLKCCQPEKKTKVAVNNPKRSTGNTMRPTTTSQAGSRVPRKTVRNIAVKRSNRVVKEEPAVDPVCDNSNDSGLGFEQHQEFQVRFVEWPGDRFSLSQDQSWVNDTPEAKRKRLEIKIESDDANDNFTFPDSVRLRTNTLLSSPVYPAIEQITVPSGHRPTKRHTQTNTSSNVFSIHKDNKPARSRALGPSVLTNQLVGLTKSRGKTVPNLVTNQMLATSRNGKTQLVIISQPEQQHRARYQTEGSRGAVKDRTGNGFPQVQLSGWVGPATLEVYIGSDCGKVVPHMFYQACRVSGKNSTQCQERTEDGTVIIEIPFEPSRDMIVTCDCVGILKERNVDVEHRFPDQPGPRNKKKSTRCRMVFRTFLTHPDGNEEMLQICSQPIACTQPPGIPEICKKSLSSSPACGGLELFILGKNFLKDTRVLFTDPELQPPWEVSVTPDKEYLQQSHLVCVVPPYHSQNISEPVTVRLTVMSSDKSSEAHCFTYTPQPSVVALAAESRSTTIVLPEAKSPTLVSEEEVQTPRTDSTTVPVKSSSTDPLLPQNSVQYVRLDTKQGGDKESIFPLVLWKTASSDGTSSKPRDVKLFSLPAVCKNLQLVKPPALVPLLSRRSAGGDIERSMNSDQSTHTSAEMKGIDLRVKADGVTVPMTTGADLCNTQAPSMATLQRFIASDNGSQLPSLNVENFLSNIEQKIEQKLENGTKDLPSQVGTKSVKRNGIRNHLPLEALLSKRLVQSVPTFKEKVDLPAQPCTRQSNTVPYSSQLTANVEQDSLTVKSGANLLQNHEQYKIISKSLVSDDFQEALSVSNHFMAENTTDSSTNSCTSRANNAVSLQGANPVISDVILQSQIMSSVGNDKEPADIHIISTDFEKNELPSTLQVNNSSNGIHAPFSTYIVESDGDKSLHSSPLECNGSIVSTVFKTYKDDVSLKAVPTSCNLHFDSQNAVSVNDIIRDSLHVSPVAEEPVSLQSEISPSVANNFIIPDSPITINSILIQSQGKALYNKPVPENAVDRNSGSNFTKCQIVKSAVSTTDAVLNMNARNPKSVFDIKDQVIATCEHTPMCSPVYSFAADTVHTDQLHSSPSSVQCGDDNQTNSNEHLKVSFSSNCAKTYSVSCTVTNSVTEPVSKSFTTSLSVNAMESDLSKEVHDSVMPSAILDERNCLSTHTVDRGQVVANIPSSLNVLMHTSVTPNAGSIPNQCPTPVEMKDLILTSNVLVNDKTVSTSCMSADSSVAVDAVPSLDVYGKTCPEPTSRGIVLSTMENGHLISQPQAVTPETARLDALVNSTLDSHIQTTQSMAGAKLKVESISALPTNTFSATTPATALLDNMFSLNNGEKHSPVECFVAADISRCVHPSSQPTTDSSSDHFQCEETSFASVPPQFGGTSGITFTSPSDSLHFTNVSTNPVVLNHLMNLQEPPVKVEEKKHKEELVVRERREEGMLSQELTQMSDHDLISYINPSCFDQV